MDADSTDSFYPGSLPDLPLYIPLWSGRGYSWSGTSYPYIYCSDYGLYLYKGI